MRKRIFKVIEIAEESDGLNNIYDVSMMIVIVLSLVPIAAKTSEGFIGTVDIIAAAVFVIDYVLRLTTADLKLKKGSKSFLLYPITPMAVIDLLAILPSLLPINGAFRVLKVFRLLRTLRVFRAFKIVRYSKSVSLIIDVFKKQSDSLLIVCGMAGGYILISAF